MVAIAHRLSCRLTAFVDEQQSSAMIFQVEPMSDKTSKPVEIDGDHRREEDGQTIRATCAHLRFPFGMKFGTGVAESNGPAVSVIMRTKDRPLLLPRGIASVTGQTFDDWHLIIVNDGGTPALVDEIVLQIPETFRKRILVVHQSPSMGMESATNTGLSQPVASRYVVIHDDDDSWHPDFLAETVGFLDLSDNANYSGVVVQCRVIEEKIEDDRIIKIGERDFNSWLTEVDLARLLAGNIMPNLSFLFRRETLDYIGTFNAELPVLGDWDFNIRMLMSADIAVLTKPLAYYHQRRHISQSLYDNTVVAEVDRHEKYSVAYRNAVLRASLQQAPWQIGPVMNTFHNLGVIQEKIDHLQSQMDVIVNTLNKIMKPIRMIFRLFYLIRHGKR